MQLFFYFVNNRVPAWRLNSRLREFGVLGERHFLKELLLVKWHGWGNISRNLLKRFTTLLYLQIFFFREALGLLEAQSLLFYYPLNLLIIWFLYHRNLILATEILRISNVLTRMF